MHYHLDHHKVAMDELIRSHMPIISRVAGSGTRNSGVNINVVVQTATEGLLIAINRRSSDAGGARPPDC
jgi:NADPH-dependent 7-cyano-7-deazaguanine reductase QueF